MPNLCCAAATNLYRGNSAGVTDGKATMLISLIRIFRDYVRRRATLVEIAHLDDRTLRDLGLVRSRLPSSWDANR
jgi:uncharacterized protein YjiS (DUF1127 family)